MFYPKCFKTAFFGFIGEKTLRMKTNWLFWLIYVWLTIKEQHIAASLRFSMEPFGTVSHMVNKRVTN